MRLDSQEHVATQREGALLNFEMTTQWRRWLIGAHFGVGCTYLFLGPFTFSLWLSKENRWAKPRPLIRRGP